MRQLEGPDDPITLARAAEIAGVTPDALKKAVQRGRLQATKPARDLFTSRRWLHRYLASRTARPDRANPLPVEYQIPEGEEPF